MLPNSWTTGAKLVIFNEITKFYRPKDASFSDGAMFFGDFL